MKQTLAQKVVARAAGRSTVTPGEIVTCKVDLAMMHDSGGPRRVKPLLERLGAKVCVHAGDSESTQGYTPFEGTELSARVEATFLRGALVCESAKVMGQPRGQYLHRPTA